MKDINVGPDDSGPDELTNVNGTLFFTAYNGDGAGQNGNELWKSDGTEAGTTLVKDINVGPDDSYPDDLTNVNGTLFFSASDGTETDQLYKIDPLVEFEYVAQPVAFEFDDISATGTAIAGIDGESVPVEVTDSELGGLSGDSVSVEVTDLELGGFEFTFYGQTYNNLFVSSNGLISFGEDNNAIQNGDLTGVGSGFSEDTQAIIAPFWDDLDGSFGGDIFYQVKGTGTESEIGDSVRPMGLLLAGSVADRIHVPGR